MSRFMLKLLFLALFAAGTACTPMYIPNLHHVPLLSNKGDISTGLNLGGSMLDIQLAYAFNQHLAAMVNSTYQKRSFGDSLSYEYEHFFLEGAVGYFTKVSKAGRFGIYGGYGRGHGYGENDYTFMPPGEYAIGYYNRLFIQANFGAVSEYFDGGFSLRGSYVDFYKYKTDIQIYYHHLGQYFMEPVMVMRMGGKHLKFQTELGFAFRMGNEVLEDYSPFVAGIGLTYYLNAFGKNHWEP